ncbi:hypothetical protein glysoja_025108 [Glycine soja]|uniref:Uncharacterized protein n=1 Tax=Glycine soja TaxID=3848 RepID=A0A0B2QDY7_GLYSO|nr:hypothetical protein glysoja_025108 [Glycine soja]
MGWKKVSTFCRKSKDLSEESYGGAIISSTPPHSFVVRPLPPSPPSPTLSSAPPHRLCFPCLE